jgi:hypothetical protein
VNLAESCLEHRVQSGHDVSGRHRLLACDHDRLRRDPVCGDASDDSDPLDGAICVPAQRKCWAAFHAERKNGARKPAPKRQLSAATKAKLRQSLAKARTANASRVTGQSRGTVHFPVLRRHSHPYPKVPAAAIATKRPVQRSMAAVRTSLIGLGGVGFHRALRNATG